MYIKLELFGQMLSIIGALKQCIFMCIADMSILRPELVWINGACFRKNPQKDPDDTGFSGQQGSIKMYYPQFFSLHFAKWLTEWSNEVILCQILKLLIY